MGYAEQRTELIDSGLRGQKLRAALAQAADEWLTALLRGALAEAGLTGTVQGTSEAHVPGLALVAVGGYGRAELCPGSDLDVLLLHDGSHPAALIAALADAVWYPVWDAKVKLDHSVRTVNEARAVARDDLPVALGLLTARHVVGDPTLTAQLRATTLADWRSRADKRLPEVRAARAERLELHGELAYRLEGDLKEAIGGLRDAYALTAISASWLADIPHGEPEAARARLLDVRAALHISTGRAADRLLLQEQDEVAAQLGLAGGADGLLAEVADAARTIAYACDVAWRRIDQVLAQRSRSGRRAAAQRTPLADGVVAADGEATLALAADPARDPVLLLRAAAAAAAAGLPLAPAALRRLTEDAAPLPTPWPRAAREEFVRLLGAGPGLVPVWEALDRTGLLSRLLPEWERTRSLPQRNALHIHTVDRHSVQTAVQAARRTRRVARPDLLLVAAVCHDLGKGLHDEHGAALDHSEAGAGLVAQLAPRLGFNASDSAVLVALVRHHLLLAQLAVNRDPDDPATLDALLAAADVPGGSVDAAEFVALLHALTEADSEATGPAVWSRWREALLSGLAERARAHLAGQAPATAPGFDGSALAQRAAAAPDRLAVLALAPGATGVARLDVALPDQIGVLATVAGVLSLRHVRILAAEVETVGLSAAAGQDGGAALGPEPRPWAVQRWTVAAEYGELPDIARLRTDLRAALGGRLDLAARMASREADHRPTGRARLAPPPSVAVLEDASAVATVIEVRAGDTPGLLYRVAAAIAQSGADIYTARVATLGAEAIDVFYLTGPDGARLSPEEDQKVAREIRAALAS
ncbi:[protein-PII] uridylyltransferase [Actinocrinis puniceicyclus]|uniref:Bifunctional uridylyltransferase/uridylyl-removing enzyme n=1 Tax=Actinocrinis puniceicyclus TaxID=977794 RepID=A0A8J8BDH2_9ACTN|nr:[protein-PII] uridylyltransferase [Actinocrinis puniceicyclus]MBS2962814.1 [protein-PII] uridylyltransferase [Actinocrinis puniceicyclus]